MTVMKKNSRFSRFYKVSYLLYVALALHGSIVLAQKNSEQQEISSQDSVSMTAPELNKLTIKNIFVEGNKYIKQEAILRRLPYNEGQIFDESKSGIAIRNIYDLGSFRQVVLEGERLDDSSMNLYVVIEEKKLLEGLEFKGNKSIKTKEIKEKLRIDKLKAIDEESIYRIQQGIKKLYRDENKHLVKVTHELVPNECNPDKACVIFTVHEGPSSKIKRVNFIGNCNIPARKLRNIIFTRENWLMSFMDSAGSYQEDMLEMDKHRIEYFYRDHGYITAKVAKPKVEFSKNKKDITVTFNIKEGPMYTVRSFGVVADEVHGEDEILPLVVLEKDRPFSQSKLVQTMTKIKDLYGESGYIYADVYPQVKPDETTHCVDVTFHIERGNKLYANRIIITGNKVTRDKVIRRQFEISEGEMITTKKLNKSQSAVEYLSFFERDGVNWRMHRLSDELADLEMNVKEAKTGNFNVMATYGTDQYNPIPSLRGMISIEKANLFGRGWDVGGLIQADRHRLRKLEAHFADPHIFDSDVSAAWYIYKRWDEYDQWNSTNVTPLQKVFGGNMRLGFWLPKIDKRLQLIVDIGIENIRNNKPHAVGNATQRMLFEPIVRRTFQEGTLTWLGLDLVKDTRNHQIYPNSGYKLTIGSKLAVPGINNDFSFLKGDVEGSYYAALIGEDSLVLGIHGKMGNIRSLSPATKPVPYKELYHMGGQATVRGFTWGGIGPAWFTGDPLGGQNAILFNSEFIFPLIPDYSMKGHVFYDAGAGWNTPKNDIPNKSLIKRDKFDLRHSIGFGLNLMKPVPAKIDWGFKLDRKKKENESAHEFHLSMNYAW